MFKKKTWWWKEARFENYFGWVFSVPSPASVCIQKTINYTNDDGCLHSALIYVHRSALSVHFCRLCCWLLHASKSLPTDWAIVRPTMSMMLQVSHCCEYASEWGSSVRVQMQYNFAYMHIEMQKKKKL